jgi:hypothetical protein
VLVITIPATEEFDEVTGEFIYSQAQTLQLEHSLLSISKWESKWCKPFLTKQDKTQEEVIDYIKCMTLNKGVGNDVYRRLTNSNFKAVDTYIGAPMTATTFVDDKRSKANREVITSELIYYWMIALNIPFDPCEKWHINRLLTLVRICNIKNSPSKNMSKRDVMSRNAKLNAARRKQFNSKG